MGTDHLKELKRLQKENDRLRRAVSELTLDQLILSEAAKDSSHYEEYDGEPGKLVTQVPKH